MSKSKSLVERVHEYRALLSKNCYRVLDTETTLIDKSKTASIFTHKPTFVVGAMKYALGDIQTCTTPREFITNVNTGTYINVGHNVMFDMHQADIDSTVLVWDTMVAQYALSNFVDKNPSLDRTAELLGIPDRKLDSVSEQIKKGICPSTMYMADLEEYLEQDVKLTTKVFLEQRALYYGLTREQQNMFIIRQLEVVDSYFKSLRGMAVDWYRAANEVIPDMEKKLNDIAEEAQYAMCSTLIGEVPIRELNPNSTQQLNAIFHGGEISWTVDEDTGKVYKSGKRAGQPKYKKVVKTYKCPGSARARRVDGVDEESLRYIKKHDLAPFSTLAQVVLNYRDLAKYTNTYLKGYLAYAEHDSFIHPNFNLCVTPTGRKSSSRPNLQNIKGDDD